MTISATNVSDRNLQIISDVNRKGILQKKEKETTHLGKFVLLVPTAQRSTMSNIWLCVIFINCLRDWQKETEKTTTRTIFTSEHSWGER